MSRYDDNYEETIQLAGGTTARVRMVRATDKALFQAGFSALSAESRYQRFFASKATLTNRELKYLTEVDAWDHVAIGALATCGPGSVPMGVARFVRDPADPTMAEAAVTIVDRFQRVGLGRALLARISEAARERGVTLLRFVALPENRAIHSVVQGCFRDVRTSRSEDGLVLLDVPVRVESPP